MRLPLLIFMLLISGWAAAQGITPTQLVGKWTPDMEATVSAMEEQEAQRYNAYPADQQEAVRQSFGNRSYEFFAMGQLKVRFTAGEESHILDGIWELTDNGSRLRLKVDQRETFYSLQLSADNHLTLSLHPEVHATGARSLFAHLVLVAIP